MSKSLPIAAVDLFAGPGGLGEGFSALDEGKAFRILVSAEMDAAAHQTLQLRAFFRILKLEGKRSLGPYYRYCNGESATPYDKSSLPAWRKAGEEALHITLGTQSGDKRLVERLKLASLSEHKPWVLIGGPPCQAYSLAGRARNKGKKGYLAEEDKRHFLYLEYLKIIQRFQPAIFVMENVKGILSSKVSGQRIFHSILKDLADPSRALNQTYGSRYKIYSIVKEAVFESGMEPTDVDSRDFILRAENFGVPQARHRVILLGVREDVATQPTLLTEGAIHTVAQAISDLPPLRSMVTKQKDGPEEWFHLLQENLSALLSQAPSHENFRELFEVLRQTKSGASRSMLRGDVRYVASRSSARTESPLSSWYSDKKLRVWLNHESRGHIADDLKRYVFAAAFGMAYGRSPKGHIDYFLKGLSPNHKNWDSGIFADRFRVQLASEPASTITSHIAKDGHYFIHPDPTQCRSLTVREAARLQTFPDNYFFQGNRTQQFAQVGNAVPPYLAYQIAKVVHKHFD